LPHLLEFSEETFSGIGDLDRFSGYPGDLLATGIAATLALGLQIEQDGPALAVVQALN
jgi:hypothetical protein